MRKVVPIVLALTLLGCATTKYPPRSMFYPPPSIKYPSPSMFYPPLSIKDGYYLSPEYQFSVKVPEGWQVSDQVPDWLKETFVGYEEKSIPVAFFNREAGKSFYIYFQKEESIPVLFFNTKRGGLIYIYVQKIDLGEIKLMYFALYSKTSEKIRLDLYHKREALLSNPSVLDYFFDLGHECEFTETLLAEDPDSLDIHKQINTGSCYHHRDHIYHFYFAILTLKSWRHTFEENFDVYKKFIEHFKTGNFMYGKDEAEK
jgi:hypothetical protein